MAETTAPTSTQSSTPSPSPDPTSRVMDQVKEGAGKLASKIESNIDELDKQMGDKLADKLADDKDEPKGKDKERDEDFQKSMMAMLRGLSEEVEKFSGDLKAFGKDAKEKLDQNESFKKGMDGLKGVAADLGLTKGEDSPDMSSPKSSASMSDIMSNLKSSLSDLSKGVSETFGSQKSSPSADNSPSPDLDVSQVAETAAKVGMGGM